VISLTVGYDGAKRQRRNVHILKSSLGVIEHQGASSVSATELLALLILILLIAAAIVLFLPLRRGATPSGADPEVERLDSRNWYLGVFYYNPDDPAVFVPKRLGLGWTINFAHPSAP
jgi:uncharacterized membrane protein